MKRIVFIISALSLLLSLSSCHFVKVSDSVIEWFEDEVSGENLISASDNYVTKTVEITDFSLLNIEFPVKVIYSPGPASCTISAPDNVVDHILFVQDNDQLVIKIGRRANFRNIRDIEVQLSSEKLSWVTVTGAGAFESTAPIYAGKTFQMPLSGAAEAYINGLVADKVDIDASGAVELKIDNLDCKDFDLDVSGAGDVEVNGTAEKARADISGAGVLDLSGLRSDDLSWDVSGAGKVIKPKA